MVHHQLTFENDWTTWQHPKNGSVEVVQFTMSNCCHSWNSKARPPTFYLVGLKRRPTGAPLVLYIAGPWVTNKQKMGKQPFKCWVSSGSVTCLTGTNQLAHRSSSLGLTVQGCGFLQVRTHVWHASKRYTKPYTTLKRHKLSTREAHNSVL